MADKPRYPTVDYWLNGIKYVVELRPNVDTLLFKLDGTVEYYTRRAPCYAVLAAPVMEGMEDA